MPTPDALGLSGPAPRRTAGETDWVAVRRRMRDLGVVAFQVIDQRQGWRFVCQLQTNKPGQFHRIEAGPVTTEAEAIALALAEAERWVEGR